MQSRRVTIAGEPLEGIRHICCFYDSREQRSDVFAPYLAEGLRDGEQVVCIFPRDEHDHVRGAVRACGADLAAAEKDDQFRILTEDETYITGNLFAKDRMADMLRTLLEEARRAKRPSVRTLGEMSWALRHLPGTDDLADYECSVPALCHEYDCTLACAYDINQFHGRVVADALATHSHIVLHGTVRKNPYYVEPAEFKRYVSLRSAGPGPVRADAGPPH